MRTYAVLSLLMIASLTTLAQDRSGVTPREKSSDTTSESPTPTKDLMQIARSDVIKTFADAFLDPNIVVGVFEYPRDITTQGLPTDEVYGFLEKYWAAQEKFGVRMMRCIKMIKGDAPISAVFVCDRLAPDLPRGLQIPSFIPVAGSTWILALQKTTLRSRLARFGSEIGDYTFLEDRTMFRMYRYGHGSLCLTSPQDEHRASQRIRTVPQTTVDDFAGICRVLPIIRKDQLTADDATRVGQAWRGMKTPTGKSVLGELIGMPPEQ
jgi:hypothetical protein